MTDHGQPQLAGLQAELTQLRRDLQALHEQLSRQEHLLRVVGGSISVLSSHLDQRLNDLIGTFYGPDDLKYRNPDLRLVQQLNLCLLCRLRDICEQNGITYWLGFGTLLGAARHQGFIPWDDDVDVCMTREDYQCFAQAVTACPDVELCTYHYRTWVRPRSTAVPLPRHRRLVFSGWPHAYFNFIDIYIYDAVDGSRARDDAARQGLLTHILQAQQELMQRFASAAWTGLQETPSPPGLATGLSQITDADLRRRMDAAIDETIAGFLAGDRFPQHGAAAGQAENASLCPPDDAVHRHITATLVNEGARLPHPAGGTAVPGADCLIYAVDNPCSPGNTTICDRGLILPAASLVFEGESFAVPCRHDDYLAYSYGNYHQLPPDAGVSHHFSDSTASRTGSSLALSPAVRAQMRARLAQLRARSAPGSQAMPEVGCGPDGS